MMWAYYDGWNWLWMVPMMLLFWGGAIALAIWAVRAFAGNRAAVDPAVEIVLKPTKSGRAQGADD